MFKAIGMAGMMAVSAVSLCAAVVPVSAADMSGNLAASLLPGAGLLLVGLFGRRKRASAR